MQKIEMDFFIHLISINLIEMANDPHHNCKKQKAFAWAKYYDQLAAEAEVANIILNAFPIPHGATVETRPADLPTHITNEYYEMACKLRKKYECSICFDVVDKDNIKITFCGHIYHSECLEELKKHNNKCAICRKNIS